MTAHVHLATYNINKVACFFAVCAVHVTIFSTGSKLPPVSNFTQLRALTRSYAYHAHVLCSYLACHKQFCCSHNALCSFLIGLLCIHTSNLHCKQVALYDTPKTLTKPQVQCYLKSFIINPSFTLREKPYSSLNSIHLLNLKH